MGKSKKINPKEELIYAFNAIEKEKGISKEVLIASLKDALASGYKKNFNSNKNVEVEINPDTLDIHVYAIKDVVEAATNEFSQISLDVAKSIDNRLDVGDVVREEVTPQDFGRVAAQTTKQVIMQKIRDAERNNIYEEYSTRVNDLITGTVSRVSRGNVFIDLGKTEGILPYNEQIPGEVYKQGERLKLLIIDVKSTTKEPQIILSRKRPHLVAKLFELEVPEIQTGVMEIFSVSREAGQRTKIAVYSKDPNVDALGSSVGYKSSRVKEIVNELGNEKIDIILYDKDIDKFIANSLSPSKVLAVFTDEEKKSSVAVVPEYQLSLAIGKEGQNVRLAARLVNWKIDIKSKEEIEAERGKSLEELIEEYKESKELKNQEAIEIEENDLEEVPELQTEINSENFDENNFENEDESPELESVASQDEIGDGIIEK